MKRNYLAQALLGAMFFVIAAFAAQPFPKDNNASSTGTKGKGYSTRMADLRESFNRDKGKVRLLLLLSPT